jgi:Chain length determinant protein
MNELPPSSSQLYPLSDRENVEVLLKPAVLEEEGYTLQDYWLVIRKHLWLIAVCIFGTVLATALVIFMMTPIYTAETTLLIEREAPRVLNIREVLAEPLGPDEYDFGSIRVPGSYVSKRSSGAPNNALPRRRTLWTNSKKPKYSGKLSCEMPRCGRNHDLSSDQKPSMVLTCTS